MPPWPQWPLRDPSGSGPGPPAAARTRARVEVAAVHGDPLPQPDQPAPARARRLVPPGPPRRALDDGAAVVGHRRSAARRGRYSIRTTGPGLVRVLDHVGQRFLDDAVGGEVHAGRQGAAPPVMASSTGSPAARTRSTRRPEPAAQRIGLRHQHRRRPPAGRLGRTGPAARAGGAARPSRSGRWPRPRAALPCDPASSAVGRAVEHPAGGARLHHHHAHVVRHHVVQFARDAGPFRLDRPRVCRLVFGLRPAQPLGRVAGPRRQVRIASATATVGVRISIAVKRAGTGGVVSGKAAVTMTAAVPPRRAPPACRYLL